MRPNGEKSKRRLKKRARKQKPNQISDHNNNNEFRTIHQSINLVEVLDLTVLLQALPVLPDLLRNQVLQTEPLHHLRLSLLLLPYPHHPAMQFRLPRYLLPLHLLLLAHDHGLSYLETQPSLYQALLFP